MKGLPESQRARASELMFRGMTRERMRLPILTQRMVSVG